MDDGSSKPPAIPDHELLRPVGRGSYGEVWMGRSVLGELRAVKLVRQFPPGDSDPAGREFDGLRKFEPVSRSHPGLVHILHAGRFDGGFYYVMELADPADAGSFPCSVSSFQPEDGAGTSAPAAHLLKAENWALIAYAPRTLRSELRHRGRLPVAECVDLALQLTEALAHLHGHGLVHRDIKPSNIIFVGGRPKLADIGLVASTDASMSCVGTEGYLPPEGPGKPAADLYALGKVLYEISTGRDRTDFPELPTLLREDVERGALEEFNEVLLKACDPDLRHRYQAADQLRADLLLLQSGRSLRGARTLRHRLVMARRAGALVAVAALLAVAATLYQQTQTREARRLALAEAEQRTRAEGLVGTLQLKQAERLFEKDEGNQGVAYLAWMLRKNPGNQIAAARLLSALTERSFALPIRVYEFPEEIEDLELSPDGLRFVTWTRGTNQVAWLWDVATGARVGEPMEHALPGVRPRFSPDGRWIVTVFTNDSVRLWDGVTGKPAGVSLRHNDLVTDVGFSPDGQALITTGGKYAQVWRIPTGERILPPLDGGSAWIQHGQFSPDGPTILTWGLNPNLWDARTGHHLVTADTAKIKGNLTAPLQFSPDGSLIGACTSWELQVWDTTTGANLLHLHQPGGITEFDFSPDGLRVATGDARRAVRIWDVATGRSLVEPLPHNMDIWGVAFDPTGERLLTRERGKARLWDSRTGRPLTEWIGGAWRAHLTPNGRQLLAHEHHAGVLRDIRPGRAFHLDLHHLSGVNLARFSRSGRRVVAMAGRERFGFGRGQMPEATLWDADSGRLAAPRIRLTGGISSAEVSPEEHAIVTTSPNGQVQFWDVRTARQLLPPLRHDASVIVARSSPDGSRLVTGSADGMARIWETATGRLLCDPLVVSNFVQAVEFSPDGGRVLVLGDPEMTSRQAIQVWEPIRPQRIDLNTTGHLRVKEAQFSPDGTRVVGARIDSPVASVWDAATGAIIGEPLRHQGTVWTARYSPDGRRIVTASTDQTARVWDARTLQPIGEAMTHEGLVDLATFSPDSRRVLTVSAADHAARVWDAETGQPLTELLGHDAAVVAGEFSPDGHRLVTASLDGTARIWDLPPVGHEVPGWLPDLAEAVAGQRFREHETPETVPAKEFLALRERLRTSSAEDPYTVWAKWFLADPLERGVSYASSVSAQEHLGRLRHHGSVQTLREAIQLAPEDADATARLAREILARQPAEYPHPERTAAFLAARAARLAPDALETWWAKAAVSAHQKEFTNALAALDRALRHEPALPDLWRLKAEWMESSGQLEGALAAWTRAITRLEAPSETPFGNPEWPKTLRDTRLRRATLLSRLGRYPEAVANRLQALGIPARDPSTPPALVDLSAHFNLSFEDPMKPWEEWSEENLASLAPGNRWLAGVRFDVRGAILAGNSPLATESQHLAAHAHGIPVHQHCRRLHFLHVIHFAGRDGVPVGRYVIRYEDGSQADIPILHDQTIGHWSGGAKERRKDLVHAWAGTDPPTPHRPSLGHLYRYGWTNPKPHLRIETVDLDLPQTPAGSAGEMMLLVAITAQAEPTPEISRQPRPQTVQAGEPATLDVEVEGEAPLDYQWQWNGQDLPGATNATLSFPRTFPSHAGSYTVQVRSRVANPVLLVTSEPASLAIQEGDLTVGLLRREVFTNLPGQKLPSLTNSVRFPQQPDAMDFVAAFESPSNVGENYGVRLTGYLIPPRTGEYRFHLSSDDEGAFFLSRNESPGLGHLVAREPDWNPSRSWTSGFQRLKHENISPPIFLEAGRRYFVEALMKQGNGEDHLAVAWQPPGEPPPKHGAPPIPGQFLAIPSAWIDSKSGGQESKSRP